MNTWRASRFRQGPGSLYLGGYVLPEILAVVGILAILILVGMPRLDLPETLSTSVVARQVAVDLRLAQQLSFSRRDTYTLEFLPAAEPYTSYTIRSESTLVEEPDFPKQIPGGLTATGRRWFMFWVGWGPYDSAWAGYDGAITIAAGLDAATVTVYWYNGRVLVTVP